MKKLVEAWREKAIWEDSKAREYHESGDNAWSQGHSSAALIYRHCADELQRHLSGQSTRSDKCSAETHALFRIGGWSICPYCDEDISGG